MSQTSGPAVVEHYGDAEGEVFAAAELGLCDLSLLPRVGICGPDTSSVLATHGLQLPEAPNFGLQQDCGDLIARLSDDEYLQVSLSALNRRARTPAATDWAIDPAFRAYWLPRADSHVLFALCGSHAPDVLSKLCGVDCSSSRFPDGKVAQTSIARQNGIIIRHNFGKTLNYLVLTATPAAEYLWECLVEAMAEFDGKPIGTAALCLHVIN